MRDTLYRATRGGIHIHTDRWEGFMKNAVDMDSVAMIRTHTKFHNDWFRYSKVDMGGYADT
jgi:hypothetical protein